MKEAWGSVVEVLGWHWENFSAMSCSCSVANITAAHVETLASYNFHSVQDTLNTPTCSRQVYFVEQSALVQLREATLAKVGWVWCTT